MPDVRHPTDDAYAHLIAQTERVNARQANYQSSGPVQPHIPTRGELATGSS
jgi:hypothetical protein